MNAWCWGKSCDEIPWSCWKNNRNLDSQPPTVVLTCVRSVRVEPWYRYVSSGDVAMRLFVPSPSNSWQTSHLEPLVPQTPQMRLDQVPTLLLAVFGQTGVSRKLGDGTRAADLLWFYLRRFAH
jgi:hypothetical protein